MNVHWHPFDYESKEVTAPVANHLVWVVEGDGDVELGYFDGFTFRLWTGTDDCDIRKWAHVDFPEAP